MCSLGHPPCLGLGFSHALRCVCASLTQRAPRTPWYQSHSPGVQPRQPPLPRSWSQSRTAVCVCFLDTASSALALVSVTLAWCAASASPPCLGLGFSHALQCVCFLDTASPALALVSVTLAWCAASAPAPCLGLGFSHALQYVCFLDAAHSPGVQPRQPPCLGLGFSHTRPVTHPPPPSSLSPFGHVTDCPSGTSLD